MHNLTEDEIRELTVVKPKKIRLETTSVCQLKCPACPMTPMEMIDKVGYLKIDTFKKVIDENPWVESVELTNHGEMFLNPHLSQILAYAYEKKVALTADVGVNLNNVKPEVLEALVKYKLRSMKVSIDGASQETYEQYRVGGNYDRVIANIEYINEMKKKYNSEFPKLNWTFIIFGHNEHEIEIARAKAAELNMSFLPKLNWAPEFSPIRDPEMVKRVTGFQALTPKEHLALHGEQVIFLRSLCYMMWSDPLINHDGKVYGCCRFLREGFGDKNALTDGVLEAINNDEMIYARKQMMGLAPDINSNQCTRCGIYTDMKRLDSYISVDFVRELIQKSKSRKTDAELAAIVEERAKSQ